MHITKLKDLVKTREEAVLFPCIVDLVENGLSADRFSSDERLPSRQDVTQFLAAWFRYINVAPEECQDWMIEYCTSVLSSISSSSKSQIRHSTKSNIKYIYRSAVEFNCRCTENICKATCDPSCMAYKEMINKEEITDCSSGCEVYTDKSEQYVPPVSSSKEQYKLQFIEATNVIQQHCKNNLPRKKIVDLLNDQGFKTRTGKSWTIGILSHEIRNLKARDPKPEGPEN